jgi:hypothetical protein
MSKTTCPLTRQDFREKAVDLPVDIAGVRGQALVREFSTGSFGWYLSQRISVQVGGVRVPVQIGLTLTVVNSKEAVP